MSKVMGLEDWRAFFLAMPAAVEEMPFGPEALVYKVAGKMFGLISWTDEPLTMNLKCEPNLALSLRDQYSAVAAGYHMNKQHWNTVTIDGSVDDALMKEWVRASYDLIYLALPKKTQREMEAKD